MPDDALAWGPISHLAHGSEVLKGVTILGAGLQQLLRRHPTEYLYGCIGADITLGKKYTGPMQAHCHSWDVGWQLVDEADTDAERAFAHGYLTHLAADVYSHNHFVPTQLVVSYRARTLRHIYWEARFDSMQDVEYREIVTDLRRRSFPACDALVQRVVARTLFSFRTNKRIFENVLALHDWDNWHRFMAGVSTRSKHVFSPPFIHHYNQACLENVFDLLRRGRRADCQAADPTGLDAITAAQRIRATLRTLHRSDAITPAIEELIRDLDGRADLTSLFPARSDSGFRASG